MKKSLILGLLLTTLSQADVLTLQSCLDKALTTHPDVKAWLLKVRQEHESVKSAKGDWLPQISASAEYDPQRTYVMPQMGEFHTINDNGWTAGISLKQKVYDFSKTSYRIEASKLHKKIAELSYEEAKALMRYRVRNAYALVLVQKEALTSRQKDLEAKQALYEQAKALVRQGLKTRADESRFLSSVKQAEDALALATAAYEKARIALEQLIGEKLGPDTGFDTTLLTRNPAATPPALDTVLQSNLTLKIARQNVDVSEADYRSVKAEHFGSVDVIADASHFETLSNYDTTLLGIRYAVPLYTGGKLNAQAQRSKIARMVAQQNADSRRRAIVQETESLMADLDEAKKRIEARKAQLEAARETKELIEARYKEGLSTYMEVLDAEAIWLDARLGLLGARYTLLEKHYRLEYLNAQ